MDVVGLAMMMLLTWRVAGLAHRNTPAFARHRAELLLGVAVSAALQRLARSALSMSSGEAFPQLAVLLLAASLLDLPPLYMSVVWALCVPGAVIVDRPNLMAGCASRGVVCEAMWLLLLPSALLLALQLCQAASRVHALDDQSGHTRPGGGAAHSTLSHSLLYNGVSGTGAGAASALRAGGGADGSDGGGAVLVGALPWLHRRRMLAQVALQACADGDERSGVADPHPSGSRGGTDHAAMAAAASAAAAAAAPAACACCAACALGSASDCGSDEDSFYDCDQVNDAGSESGYLSACDDDDGGEAAAAAPPLPRRSRWWEQWERGRRGAMQLAARLRLRALDAALWCALQLAAANGAMEARLLALARLTNRADVTLVAALLGAPFACRLVFRTAAGALWGPSGDGEPAGVASTAALALTAPEAVMALAGAFLAGRAQTDTLARQLHAAQAVLYDLLPRHVAVALLYAGAVEAPAPPPLQVSPLLYGAPYGNGHALSGVPSSPTSRLHVLDGEFALSASEGGGCGWRDSDDHLYSNAASELSAAEHAAAAAALSAALVASLGVAHECGLQRPRTGEVLDAAALLRAGSAGVGGSGGVSRECERASEACTREHTLALPMALGRASKSWGQLADTAAAAAAAAAAPTSRASDAAARSGALSGGFAGLLAPHRRSGRGDAAGPDAGSVGLYRMRTRSSSSGGGSSGGGGGGGDGSAGLAFADAAEAPPMHDCASVRGAGVASEAEPASPARSVALSPFSTTDLDSGPHGTASRRPPPSGSAASPLLPTASSASAAAAAAAAPATDPAAVVLPTRPRSTRPLRESLDAACAGLLRFASFRRGAPGSVMGGSGGGDPALRAKTAAATTTATMSTSAAAAGTVDSSAASTPNPASPHTSSAAAAGQQASPVLPAFRALSSGAAGFAAMLEGRSWRSEGRVASHPSSQHALPVAPEAQAAWARQGQPRPTSQVSARRLSLAMLAASPLAEARGGGGGGPASPAGAAPALSRGAATLSGLSGGAEDGMCHGGYARSGGSSVVGMSGAPTHLPPLTEWHDSVTVMFMDLVGFTSLCESTDTALVVAMLNDLYSRLDYLAGQRPVYKIMTIGDAYFVATGLLHEDPDHAATALEFAIAALRCAACVVIPGTQRALQLRVGLHSGRVMSGMVGSLRRQYTLFGDTVNTASRMESTGVPGRIQVSQATHDLLRHRPEYRWECRGNVFCKGKGVVTTYLLATEAEDAAGGAAGGHGHGSSGGCGGEGI